jgi:hypothetical protein
MKLKHLNLNFIDPLTRLGNKSPGPAERTADGDGATAARGPDSILTETYLAATEQKVFPECVKVYGGARCVGKVSRSPWTWTPHIPGDNCNIAPGVEILAELRDGTWATDFAENLFWGIVRECPAVEIVRWRPLYPV